MIDQNNTSLSCICVLPPQLLRSNGTTFKEFDNTPDVIINNWFSQYNGHDTINILY